MLAQLIEFASAPERAGIALVLVGLTAGLGLMAAISVLSGFKRRANLRTLRCDVEELRRAHASASNHLRFIRTASLSLKGLPAFEFEGATFSSAAPMPVSARAGKNLAEDLAASLNNNISCSISITDLIIDGDLEKDNERRSIAAGIKKESRNLDASFWNRHGRTIDSSDLPSDLKAEIKRFFAQVGSLKSSATSLKDAPSAEEILQVGLEAIEILQTASNMYEIIERHQ